MSSGSDAQLGESSLTINPAGSYAIGARKSSIDI